MPDTHPPVHALRIGDIFREEIRLGWNAAITGRAPRNFAQSFGFAIAELLDDPEVRVEIDETKELSDFLILASIEQVLRERERLNPWAVLAELQRLCVPA